MSNHTAKELRKSLRNVVQDIMPEILTKEITASAFKQLRTEIQFQLKQIDTDIKKALKDMEDRQKDVQSMLLREMISNQKFQSKAAGHE